MSLTSCLLRFKSFLKIGIGAVCGSLSFAPAFASVSSAYQIEVLPLGADEKDSEALAQRVLNMPHVKAALQGLSYRVLAVEMMPFLSSPPDTLNHVTDGPYAVQIYDYTNDRLLTVSEQLGETSLQQIQSSQDQPLPIYDEFRDAIELLRQDPILGPPIRRGELDPYPAMPVLLEPSSADSSTEGRRVLPIGLRPTSSEHEHEIVAVDLSHRKITRFAQRSPPDSIATQQTCGPASANQTLTRIGAPGSAEVTVRRGDETLWRMKVIRPSASTGRWGSGIELREVHYRDQLVFHRAHTPILTVDYTDHACGPYRDPVNFENAFMADGTRVTSGILKTTEMPQTIFESGRDRGNYWGVAIFEDDEQLVLKSELSAGWYRYVSEYRFKADGTILPIFKFDAVHNSCTCLAHNHHVYWRLDFDVDGATPNAVQVLGDSGWRPVTEEEKHVRNESHQAWRVYSPSTGRGYEIRPGPNDGPTNEFGAGDAWILKYNGGEIDDARFGRDRHAKLDGFLTGESVEDTDIVFWYGGHILHDENGEEVPHIAGPTLRPWRVGEP